jgi:hypothetical protein
VSWNLPLANCWATYILTHVGSTPNLQKPQTYFFTIKPNRRTNFQIYSGTKQLSTVHHVPVPNIQWLTPEDGQRDCPKHVEFRTRINLEISTSVGFYCKEICYDARSHECKKPQTYFINFTKIWPIVEILNTSMTLPNANIMWHWWQMSECVWATVTVEWYWYGTSPRKSCPNSNFNIINLTLCSSGWNSELRGESSLHRIKFSHENLRYFISSFLSKIHF